MPGNAPSWLIRPSVDGSFVTVTYVFQNADNYGYIRTPPNATSCRIRLIGAGAGGAQAGALGFNAGGGGGGWSEQNIAVTGGDLFYFEARKGGPINTSSSQRPPVESAIVKGTVAGGTVAMATGSATPGDASNTPGVGGIGSGGDTNGSGNDGTAGDESSSDGVGASSVVDSFGWTEFIGGPGGIGGGGGGDVATAVAGTGGGVSFRFT
jgi:hypothetical protein